MCRMTSHLHPVLCGVIKGRVPPCRPSEKTYLERNLSQVQASSVAFSSRKEQMLRCSSRKKRRNVTCWGARNIWLLGSNTKALLLP